MTIVDERVVDYVGVSEGQGTIVMTISDHLEWTDFECHSMTLESKINYYLEYIYSNKLFESSSKPKNPHVRIQLMMKHEPTSEATMLLKKFEGQLEELGFEFVYRVFDEHEKPDRAL